MSSTNDYMNKVIRIRNSNLSKDYSNVIFRYVDGKLRVIPVSYGYHYGDLGKGRDTYFWDIDSSNRSTGHYGTGTYFFSEEAKDKDLFKSDRPLHKVNFNEYNLFKPRNETDAFILHSGLRAVNYIRDFDNQTFEHMKIMLMANGVKNDDIGRALSKVKQTYYSSKYQNSPFDAKLDSMSTVFMKELGYNGIDVRNIKGYDNSSYGSVIYDLDKKKKK